MPGTQSIIEFVRTNVFLSILSGILISLIIWKTRQHITQHRNLSTMARDIRFATGNDWQDADGRREYQNEVASLADSLLEHHKHHPIKNERVLVKLRAAANNCYDLADTWEVRSVTGPFETANTHASKDIESDLQSQQEVVTESVNELRQEIQLSFFLSPLLNTITLFKGLLTLIFR